MMATFSLQIHRHIYRQTGSGTRCHDGFLEDSFLVPIPKMDSGVKFVANSGDLPVYVCGDGRPYRWVFDWRLESKVALLVGDLHSESEKSLVANREILAPAPKGGIGICVVITDEARVIERVAQLNAMERNVLTQKVETHIHNEGFVYSEQLGCVLEEVKEPAHVYVDLHCRDANNKSHIELKLVFNALESSSAACYCSFGVEDYLKRGALALVEDARQYYTGVVGHEPSAGMVSDVTDIDSLDRDALASLRESSLSFDRSRHRDYEDDSGLWRYRNAMRNNAEVALTLPTGELRDLVRVAKKFALDADEILKIIAGRELPSRLAN